MSQLEIGLIGAGLMAQIHLDAWAKTGARVRVYADDDRAAALAREFGCRAVDSHEQAMNGADAVDICTPTASHRDLALTAIAAGIGVICEKPLGVSSSETEEIVEAAERAGIPLFPAYNARFWGPYAQLHTLVARGGVGTGAVARFTVTAYHPRPWTEHASARSGGILTDQMQNGIDVAHWIFGDVVGVYACYQGKLTAPAPEGTVANGTAVLTHASGAISQVMCGWAPPPTPVHCTFSVSGTGGTAWYDSASHAELRVTGGEMAPITPIFLESPFDAEIREFATALADGTPARIGGRDALAISRIVEAAAKSAWTGQAVTISAQGGKP